MTVYMFPGQGSQFRGMGGELFDHFPDLTEIADVVLGYSIKALCLTDERKQLNSTEFTQPALYVVNALSFNNRIKRGARRPDYLLGHSLGEYNALQAAGAISFEDGLKLVKRRGALMSEAPKGAMAATLGISSTAVADVLQEHALAGIDIANYNADLQTIISGPEAELEKAMTAFQAAGATCMRLNTSGAFHSRYMDPVKGRFIQYLNQFRFSELQTPVISNAYARPYRGGDIANTLAAQIASPVRWMESITFLLDQGETEFLELGEGAVLTKLVDQVKKQGRLRSAQGTDAHQGLTPRSSTPMAAKTSEARDPGDQRRGDVESIKLDPEKRISDWNDLYPVGTRVVVKGRTSEFLTRTSAVVLFGHRAAVYMQGQQGYFDLDDVTPFSHAMQ